MIFHQKCIITLTMISVLNSLKLLIVAKMIPNRSQFIRIVSNDYATTTTTTTLYNTTKKG